MMDDLQLLLLSSIKIQLWMLRVVAALLRGSTRLSGGEDDNLQAACCALPAVSGALRSCGSQWRESPKKCDSHFVFIVGFINPTARVPTSKTNSRDEEGSNPKLWKRQMKPRLSVHTE